MIHLPELLASNSRPTSASRNGSDAIEYSTAAASISPVAPPVDTSASFTTLDISRLPIIHASSISTEPGLILPQSTFFFPAPPAVTEKMWMQSQQQSQSHRTSAASSRGTTPQQGTRNVAATVGGVKRTNAMREKEGEEEKEKEKERKEEKMQMQLTVPTTASTTIITVSSSTTPRPSPPPSASHPPTIPRRTSLHSSFGPQQQHEEYDEAVLKQQATKGQGCGGLNRAQITKVTIEDLSSCLREVLPGHGQRWDEISDLSVTASMENKRALGFVPNSHHTKRGLIGGGKNSTMNAAAAATSVSSSTASASVDSIAPSPTNKSQRLTSAAARTRTPTTDTIEPQWRLALASTRGSILYVPHRHLMDDGALVIRDLLLSNPTITKLDARANGFTPQACAYILSALPYSNITSLDLSAMHGFPMNHLGEQGAHALKQAFQMRSSEKSRVASAAAGGSRMRYDAESGGESHITTSISPAPSSSGCSLRALRFENIGSYGILNLITLQTFEYGLSLKILDLRKNNIGGEGIGGQVGEVMMQNANSSASQSQQQQPPAITETLFSRLCRSLLVTRLEKLLLSHNNLSEGKASQTQQNNHSRIHPSRDEQSINTTSLLTLLSSRHSTITYLDLSHNNWGKSFCSALGQMFTQDRHSLTQLILDNNTHLTDSGASAVCYGLMYNSTLKYLSMRDCDLTRTASVNSPWGASSEDDGSGLLLGISSSSRVTESMYDPNAIVHQAKMDAAAVKAAEESSANTGVGVIPPASSSFSFASSSSTTDLSSLSHNPSWIEMLRTNTVLLRLDLSENRFTSSSLAKLFRFGLSRNTGLQIIELAHMKCKLDDGLSENVAVSKEMKRMRRREGVGMSGRGKEKTYVQKKLSNGKKNGVGGEEKNEIDLAIEAGEDRLGEDDDEEEGDGDDGDNTEKGEGGVDEKKKDDENDTPKRSTLMSIKNRAKRSRTAQLIAASFSPPPITSSSNAHNNNSSSLSSLNLNPLYTNPSSFTSSLIYSLLYNSGYTSHEPVLQVIDLSHNHLNDPLIIYLYKYIIHHNIGHTNLSQLRLGYNNIQERYISLINNNLLFNTRQHSLKLLSQYNKQWRQMRGCELKLEKCVREIEECMELEAELKEKIIRDEKELYDIRERELRETDQLSQQLAKIQKEREQTDQELVYSLSRLETQNIRAHQEFNDRSNRIGREQQKEQKKLKALRAHRNELDDVVASLHDVKETGLSELHSNTELLNQELTEMKVLKHDIQIVSFKLIMISGKILRTYQFLLLLYSEQPRGQRVARRMRIQNITTYAKVNGMSLVDVNKLMKEMQEEGVNQVQLQQLSQATTTSASPTTTTTASTSPTFYERNVQKYFDIDLVDFFAWFFDAFAVNMDTAKRLQLQYFTANVLEHYLMIPTSVGSSSANAAENTSVATQSLSILQPPYHTLLHTHSLQQPSCIHTSKHSTDISPPIIPSNYSYQEYRHYLNLQVIYTGNVAQALGARKGNLQQIMGGVPLLGSVMVKKEKSEEGEEVDEEEKQKGEETEKEEKSTIKQDDKPSSPNDTTTSITITAPDQPSSTSTSSTSFTIHHTYSSRLLSSFDIPLGSTLLLLLREEAQSKMTQQHIRLQAVHTLNGGVKCTSMSVQKESAPPVVGQAANTKDAPVPPSQQHSNKRNTIIIPSQSSSNPSILSNSSSTTTTASSDPTVSQIHSELEDGLLTSELDDSGTQAHVMRLAKQQEKMRKEREKEEKEREKNATAAVVAAVAKGTKDQVVVTQSKQPSPPPVTSASPSKSFYAVQLEKNRNSSANLLSTGAAAAAPPSTDGRSHSPVPGSNQVSDRRGSMRIGGGARRRSSTTMESNSPVQQTRAASEAGGGVATGDETLTPARYKRRSLVTSIGFGSASPRRDGDDPSSSAVVGDEEQQRESTIIRLGGGLIRTLEEDDEIRNTQRMKLEEQQRKRRLHRLGNGIAGIGTISNSDLQHQPEVPPLLLNQNNVTGGILGGSSLVLDELFPHLAFSNNNPQWHEVSYPLWWSVSQLLEHLCKLFDITEEDVVDMMYIPGLKSQMLDPNVMVANTFAAHRGVATTSDKHSSRLHPAMSLSTRASMMSRNTNGTSSHASIGSKDGSEGGAASGGTTTPRAGAGGDGSASIPKAIGEGSVTSEDVPQQSLSPRQKRVQRGSFSPQHSSLVSSPHTFGRTITATAASPKSSSINNSSNSVARRSINNPEDDPLNMFRAIVATPPVPAAGVRPPSQPSRTASRPGTVPTGVTGTSGRASVLSILSDDDSTSDLELGVNIHRIMSSENLEVLLKKTLAEAAKQERQKQKRAKKLAAQMEREKNQGFYGGKSGKKKGAGESSDTDSETAQDELDAIIHDGFSFNTHAAALARKKLAARQKERVSLVQRATPQKKVRGDEEDENRKKKSSAGSRKKTSHKRSSLTHELMSTEDYEFPLPHNDDDDDVVENDEDDEEDDEEDDVNDDSLTNSRPLTRGSAISSSYTSSLSVSPTLSNGTPEPLPKSHPAGRTLAEILAEAGKVAGEVKESKRKERKWKREEKKKKGAAATKKASEEDEPDASSSPVGKILIDSPTPLTAITTTVIPAPPACSLLNLFLSQRFQAPSTEQSDFREELMLKQSAIQAEVRERKEREMNASLVMGMMKKKGGVGGTDDSVEKERANTPPLDLPTSSSSQFKSSTTTSSTTTDPSIPLLETRWASSSVQKLYLDRMMEKLVKWGSGIVATQKMIVESASMDGMQLIPTTTDKIQIELDIVSTSLPPPTSSQTSSARRLKVPLPSSRQARSRKGSDASMAAKAAAAATQQAMKRSNSSRQAIRI